MALYSTTKANALARDLADRLTLRFSGSSTIDTVRQTQDSAGWPMLFCSNGGAETAGNPVIAIRIKNIDVGATDIFGNSTLPFAPHTCEVAYELNAYTHPIPTAADYTTAVVECAKMGTIFVEEAIAHNTAVTAASMDASTPVNTLRDIDWSNKGNV